MEELFSTYDVEEVGDYLKEKGIPDDIVACFKGGKSFWYSSWRINVMLLMFVEHQLDGQSFLDLSELDIKGIVKPLGVVKKLLRLQKEVSGKLLRCSLVPSHSPKERKGGESGSIGLC